VTWRGLVGTWRLIRDWSYLLTFHVLPTFLRIRILMPFCSSCQSHLKPSNLVKWTQLISADSFKFSAFCYIFNLGDFSLYVFFFRIEPFTYLGPDWVRSGKAHRRCCAPWGDVQKRWRKFREFIQVFIYVYNRYQECISKAPRNEHSKTDFIRFSRVCILGESSENLRIEQNFRLQARALLHSNEYSM